MSFLIILVITYFCLLFSYFFLLIVLLRKRKNPSNAILQDTPTISILVAARNEELNIINCLEALNRLNYPVDKFEVLIGDDASEDNTFKVVNNFIKDKSNFSVFKIQENLGNALGKANVLATLAKRAKGEYFFITDADIEVQANWVKGLLSQLESDEYGIISGVTLVKDESLWTKMQNIEWLFSFGMIHVVSNIGIPVTAVGNNMVISRKAYESVGGYESIPFSVTEDFALFQETIKRGWKYKNLLNVDALAATKAISSLPKLLIQRRRWMTGAVQLPMILVLCLSLQAIFFPFFILTLSISPLLGILAFLLKIVLQAIFLYRVLKRLEISSSLLKYSLHFELYSGIVNLLALVYYILPGKIEWKGRKF